MNEPRDPMRAAQANMRQPTVRRFYKTVEVREAEGGGFGLMLDRRAARTPGRNRLAAASRALMERVAEEWARQGETVDPADMPLTRLLNSAIDGVSRTMDETRDDIARYAGSDLLCYRAEAPEALAERQRLAFDPVLAWAAETFGARFDLAAGVVHVAQPPEALAAVSAALDAVDDSAALAALSVITSLTGGARLPHPRSGVGSCPCRRGLPDRAMGRRRGGKGAARGALAGDGGGGERARGEARFVASCHPREGGGPESWGVDARHSENLGGTLDTRVRGYDKPRPHRCTAALVPAPYNACYARRHKSSLPSWPGQSPDQVRGRP